MRKSISKLLSLIIASAILITPIMAVLPVSMALAAGNLVVNGDFSAGQNPWWTAGVSADTSSGALVAPVPATAVNPWEAIVGQGGIPVTEDVLYTLSFDAWASTPATVRAIVQLDGPPFTAYINQQVALTTSSKKYSYTFTSPVTDPASVLQFQIGGNGAFDFHVDNVSLETTTQRVANGDFSAGQNPWWTAGVTADTSSGALVAPVPATAVNPWEAIVGQGGISVTEDVVYTFSFDAWASAPATVRAIVQLDAPPFTGYFNEPVVLTTTPQHFSYTFTSPVTDSASAMQFQLGGNGAFDFHVDNVSLTEPSDPEPPGPADPPSHIGELLDNGSFSNGDTAPWWSTSSVSLAVAQGRLEANITNGGANPWDAILGQSDIAVFANGNYTLTLKAWASAPATVNAILQQDGAPFTQYFSTPLALTTTPKTFTFNFTSSAEDMDAVLQFQMGGQGNIVVFLDNLSLNGPEAVSQMSNENIFPNGDFSNGFNAWWNSAGVTIDTSGGELQASVVNPGSNPWDVIIGQNNISLLEDGDYTLEFDARASVPVTVTTLLQLNGPPFTSYFSSPVPLTTSTQHFSYSFTSGVTDPAAGFQFHIGSRGQFVLYLDNVSLEGPVPTPPTEFLTIVRLNQHGYMPDAPKRATVATDVTSPLQWKLYNGANSVVKSGTTAIFGMDDASGDHVHIVDFSSFKTPGSGYTLEVYGERSYPFDIGNNVYKQLQYDALAYFYHNRSGIAISMPYAGDAQWTRPAGHINVAPNQGDNDVPCFDQMDPAGHQYTGCSYTLDVAKGWYDAGDHGKYVVNGGISVWTMLNQYERARLTDNKLAFGDGKLNIPENNNGVPDILDEARWQMEFMLSMQVPKNGIVEGVRMDGMVHHKMHDLAWTGLGLAPDQDPQPRYLYPPSTAATLNLAANAAQCARIWEKIDKNFSKRCLKAAETAWEAARKHPAVYANDGFTGGGGYGDTDVSDEFYWAASELFITTGKRQYEKFIENSPYYLQIPAGPADGSAITGSSMGWPKTQALGTISLALVPNDLSRRDVERARRNITEVASGYVAALPHEGYVLPYTSDNGGYSWGSNSDVLNNMIILGLAYDFTGHSKYAKAVSEGMDYILGRNPNVKSYVAGYGEHTLENPHHRFWAPSLGSNFPPPFPGTLSGGPNSFLQDPFVQALFADGCAPQKCYVDDLQSFSTNEVTINWNSPLAWAAAFLADARELKK
jgi:endoglucanase